MTEPKERFRTIKGPWLLGSLAVGALVGLALHLSDGRLFPWWTVVSASFAAVFALGARLRRARWEEESTAALLAVALLLLPLAVRSLWFCGCVVIVMSGYWLLGAVVRAQRAGRGE